MLTCAAHIANLPSHPGLLNTQTASLQRGKPHNKDCSGGEVTVMLESRGFGVPLYCHHSQVDSGPEWKHMIGSFLWVK